jgi:hypothetical protein
MGVLRRLLRPRKHTRYFTSPGSFVVVGPYTSTGRKIQILDISEGGCAFIYNGTKEELEESGYLSLLDGDTPLLDRVDFTTASDSALPKPQNNSGWLRRRGVEFKWLGVVDRRRLKEYIKQNSLGRAS